MNPQPTEQQTKEILDRLEELHKKATPGEWSIEGSVVHNETCIAECHHIDAHNDAQLIATLHNAFPLLLSLSSRTLTAEAELQKAQRESEEALQHAKAMAENAALWSELLDDAKATITSLRSTVARMEGLIEKLFASATPNPNDHPTMYVAWAEAGDFLNERNAALQPAQSTPPLAQTAMDWDERLPYVPEKKTAGLPAQSTATVEEPHAKGLEDLQTQYRLKRGPEYEAGKVLARYLFEHPELERLVLTRSGADGGGIFEVEPTPPQEQKTGGAA